jgi:GntR family transcriptional repressor for pyruvate dehydrogenase complex
MSSLQLVPPHKKTVVESIIEQLIERIKDGTLKPGAKLPSERQLIDMLHVSRSSVREALQALSAMDLTESRAGDGTFVKDLKPQFYLSSDIQSLSSVLQRQMYRHMNQARLVLESGIAEIAATHMTPETRQTIADALHAYEAGASAISEETGWPGHNQVHQAIAEAAGNPILTPILQSLLAHIPQSLRRKTLLQGSQEEIAHRIAEEQEIHLHLCQAIMQGDAPEARRWIEQHAEHEEHLIDAYNTEHEGDSTR